MTTKTAKKAEKNPMSSSNTMFIQKVKINNDKTATIFYRTSNDNSAKEVYYSGKDEITESFYDVFQQTVQSFAEVIPALKKDVSKITMNAIKFDYGKDEYLKSALYSVKYAFNEQSNAIVNISSPPLPIYKEGFESTFCISGKDEEKLHEVIAKAKAYMDGETRTKQMKLVVDNTNEN